MAATCPLNAKWERTRARRSVLTAFTPAHDDGGRADSGMEATSAHMAHREAVATPGSRAGPPSRSSLNGGLFAQAQPCPSEARQAQTDLCRREHRLQQPTAVTILRASGCKPIFPPIQQKTGSAGEGQPAGPASARRRPRACRRWHRRSALELGPASAQHPRRAAGRRSTAPALVGARRRLQQVDLLTQQGTGSDRRLSPHASPARSGRFV